MTIYAKAKHTLAAVADQLETMYIEAIATENPLQMQLAAALFLAKHDYTFDGNLGVYVSFMSRYENCQAVQERRAELIRQGKRYGPKS